ncbi:MAG: hypothetical protein ABL861_03020 [Nitrosomonas sp.]
MSVWPTFGSRKFDRTPLLGQKHPREQSLGDNRISTDGSYAQKLAQVLLRSEPTAIDLPTPSGGGEGQSSGLDAHGKSHRSAFKFPLIPSGFDACIIIS